jgi:hypothetical protein
VLLLAYIDQRQGSAAVPAMPLALTFVCNASCNKAVADYIKYLCLPPTPESVSMRQQAAACSSLDIASATLSRPRKLLP